MAGLKNIMQLFPRRDWECGKEFSAAVRWSALSYRELLDIYKKNVSRWAFVRLMSSP